MTTKEWNARMAQHCRDEAARLRRIMGDDYPPSAECDEEARKWESAPGSEWQDPKEWSAQD